MLLLLPCAAGAAVVGGGEQTYQYRVTWNGIPAAQATVTLTEHPGQQPPTTWLSADLRTNHFVDLFWSLRAQSWAEVEASTLRPVRFMFDRRINGRPETTRVDAEEGGLLTGRYGRPWRYRLVEVNAPDALDPMTAVLRVRHALPAVGQSSTYDIFTGEARYRIELHRYPPETIDVPAGRFLAARVEPVIWRVDQGGPDTRVRHVTFWVTDEAPHALLRVRGEVFIGAVYADLTGWSRHDTAPRQ
jgi:hypothetical protein